MPGWIRACAGLIVYMLLMAMFGLLVGELYLSVLYGSR